MHEIFPEMALLFVRVKATPFARIQSPDKQEVRITRMNLISYSEAVLYLSFLQLLNPRLGFIVFHDGVFLFSKKTFTHSLDDHVENRDEEDHQKGG